MKLSLALLVVIGLCAADHAEHEHNHDHDHDHDHDGMKGLSGTLNGLEDQLDYYGEISFTQEGTTLEITYDLENLNSTLIAEIERYPNSTESYEASGVVAVHVTDDHLSMYYDMENLEKNTSAELHIHEGKTCENAGGHFFAGNGTDPWNVWTPENSVSDTHAGHNHNHRERRDHNESDHEHTHKHAGTRYETDTGGRAKGYLRNITTGYIFHEKLGRTVVVHLNNGSRIGCGVLYDAPGYIDVYEAASCQVDTSSLTPIASVEHAGTANTGTASGHVNVENVDIEGKSVIAVLKSAFDKSVLACAVLSESPSMSNSTTTAVPDTASLVYPSVTLSMLAGVMYYVL